MNGMSKKLESITESLVLIGIGLAAAFWIIEAAVQVFIFDQGGLIEQISNPPAHEIWVRSFVGATFIGFAIYAELIAKQRRQADKATKLAHAELNQIFEGAADGMRLVDKDFNVLRVNRAFSTLSGLIKSQAVGRKCYAVFGGPLCHTPDCAVTRILDGEEHVEYDAEKERNDGGIVQCIVTARPFRGHDGELVGIIENLKDIRDRKEWEERLQESEAQKRAILDASVDMIMQVNGDMRIVWANRIAAEVVSKPLEEFIGQKCYHVFKYADAPCPGCPCKKAFETGNIEHQIMHHDAISAAGESYWEDYGVPLKNESGEIMGVILIARNVTEEKRAERALMRAKKDWENTFDSIADAVMLLDRDHRIVRVNRAGAEALNTTKEGLMGRKCYEAMHGQDHPTKECPLVPTMKRLEPQTAEITEPNVGGGTFICSTSPILDGEGKLAGYTQGLKDISESRRLQTQLQDAQRMEAIGTLAGGIAHDFNNLLMGIQGNVSLILLDLDPSNPHYKRLENTEKQIRSGAKLTSHLLGYARKGRYEVKAVNVNRLIEETSDPFSRTKKEITIRRELADDLFAIEADSTQIEQVLWNLYVNAADALPGGGDLIIKTRNVSHKDLEGTLYEPEPGPYISLTVTDTGVGMDQKTMERVFDPFFTTKEMGRGTGLGLASAYGIVKAHGGHIAVESEKGKGTAFSVYLPASEKEVQRTDKTAQRFVEGSGTVLLVEDEETVMKVGQELLETIGYRVVGAKDGKEAVKVYKQDQDSIDIVVLDMVMPNMGGGQAYDRLKAVNPDVKVLLSSGYSIDGEASQILKRGCDGFIQKPFNLKDLSEKIGEILHQ